MSQRYADLNGGRIECESVKGEGATFRFILPAAADGAGEAEPEAGAAAG